jgi:uncharacterized cupredoxin-like copper-binding protein
VAIGVLALIAVGVITGWLIARGGSSTPQSSASSSPGVSVTSNPLPTATAPGPSVTLLPQGGGRVTAAVRGGSITLSSARGVTGLFRFIVTNQGKVEHEFEILRTNRRVDALPFEAGENKVRTDAPGIVSIDDKSIDRGQSETLIVSLAPGNYVIICNKDGHYRAGERAGFTVTSP